MNAQNGKDAARAPSPLAKSSDGESKPAASRITTSAALRSSATGPRKANILGAKKPASKLGAKKVASDAIDFDAAERKAKEEAERIAKLGYDPDAEEEQPAPEAAADKPDSSAAIISPTPVSSAPAGYGSSHTREKSAAEMERLGMGIRRLGFGQVGRPAAQKNAGGFGSVGPIKASASSSIKSMPLVPIILRYPDSFD